MKKFLILDANNLAFRTFHSSHNDEEVTTAIVYQQILNTLNYFYKKYEATDIVVAFDSKNNWRKLYTKDQRSADNIDGCITKKIYKDHRNDNKTKSEIKKLNDFKQNIADFSEILKERTGLIVLKEKYLEADDLIAGMVQKFKDDQHVIVSSDQDFIQLLTNSNVFIVDPLTEKQRDLLEWDHDANFFMFEKCFRGDRGDNVQNAYPYLSSKKIKAAYIDKFLFTNLMEYTFDVDTIIDGNVEKYQYKTKELFEENKLLMDLTQQPDYIRELIDNCITGSINNRSKYNMIEFLKFCGKNELVDIIQNIDKYSKLLSGKGKITSL